MRLFPGVNPGAFLAAIIIGSPVFGFLPFFCFLALIENVPNPDEFFSTGLAKIRITIPTNQNQSDVVSYVAEVLHANGIELVNAFFSQDSIIVILRGTDASRAYEILHSEIARV